MRVCVITPSLPGRASLLEQCKASVAAQTVAVEHLVGVDEAREGPSVIRNRLAASTDADWLLPLDDDDVLDPSCIATLLEHADGADVIYPWCRMIGRTDGWVPNKLFSRVNLFQANYIPITALIRHSLFDVCGGFQSVPLEDWVLWQWIELHGGRFRCVPEILWSYRHHAGQNFQKEAA